MGFLFRVFLFGTCLHLVSAYGYRVPRRKRSPVKVAVVEDTVCASGCINLLRVSTEADDVFRQHFLELGSLGSVVPQTMISTVDLATFQRYCLNVYNPVRECLVACSRNFTAELLRSMTMLETLCVDYYQEMNRFMPCMKFAYEQTTSTCEARCLPPGFTDTNETAAMNSTSDEGTSSTTELIQHDESVYLKPNETMSLFCMLLECVSVCEIPILQRHCGHDAAVLEAVLVDAMARIEKVTVQLEESVLWPVACDNLILPEIHNGQETSRRNVLWWLVIMLFCLILRTC